MDRKQLSRTERLDWIQLIRTKNIGPVTFRQLLTQYGTASAALEALPRLARRAGLKHPPPVYPRRAAQAELDEIDALGGQIVALCEPEYPKALAATSDAPPLLFTRGHLNLFQETCVSIVGTRNASAIGTQFTHSLAQDLGKKGMAIVSGMARGIDSAAHEGALASGTICVLAGGVDVVYPTSNQALYEEVLTQGLLISEQPLGTPITPKMFPIRNRIIAGLSCAVIVVEASLRSGSLITARCAADYGREVCAVPHFPLDPRGRGNNKLLREGAALVETTQDVLDVIDSLKHKPVVEDISHTPYTTPSPQLLEVQDAERETVRQLLSTTPVHIDEIIRQSRLSAQTVNAILAELHVAEIIIYELGPKVRLAQGEP